MCPSAVDATDGGLYKISTAGSQLAFAHYFSNATEPIVDRSGILHAGAYEANIAGYSTWTARGAHNWDVQSSTLPSQLRFNSVPTVDVQGKVYITAGSDLLCIDGATGSVVSSFTVPGRLFTTQPVISNDGSLYVATDLGIVYAFRDLTGGILVNTNLATATSQRHRTSDVCRSGPTDRDERPVGDIHCHVRGGQWLHRAGTANADVKCGWSDIL
jgi:outer membrane protein assembly factor BamB